MNDMRTLSLAGALLAAPIACFAQVVPDGTTNTTVSTAASGRQTVQVAPALSNNAVSYNAFSQFNVSRSGLDINNADARARLIVSEVTSTLPSRIEGDITVLGARANFVLANPNGITVNGGRFVNTGSLALVTGRVKLVDFESAPGVMTRTAQIGVEGGEIRIEGAGLSGAFNSLDLVSQRLRVAGPVTNETEQPNARTRVIAGQSTALFNSAVSPVDDATPWVSYGTPKDPVSQTGVAVDITALGSLTGGRVEVLVTDKGAGVRHAGQVTASVGGFVLQADGRVEIVGGGVQARDAIVLAASSIDIRADQDNAGKRAVLKADGDVQLLTNDLAIRSADIGAGTEERAGSVILGLPDKDGETDLTIAASSIKASGGIGVFRTGRNVQVQGSTLESLGGISIKARNLDVVATDRAAKIDSARSSLTIDASAEVFLQGASLQGAAELVINTTRLRAIETRRGEDVNRLELRSNGGGVRLNSASDVVLVGADVLAREHVVVNAAQNVEILAGVKGSQVAAIEGGLLIDAKGHITNAGSVLQGKAPITAPANPPANAPAPITTDAAVTLRAGGNILNSSRDAEALAIVFGGDGDIRLSAGGDIVNQTGRFIANRHAYLQAGGDFLNLVTLNQGTGTTDTQTGDKLLGISRTVRTSNIDLGALSIPNQLAYVVANGNIEINARNITSRGGEMNANNGSVRLNARERVVTEALAIGTASFTQRCYIFCRSRSSNDVFLVGGTINASERVEITAGTRVDNLGGRVLAVNGISVKAPEVHAVSRDVFVARGIYRGLATKFGQQWAALDRIGQGGVFRTLTGEIEIDGRVTIDGGELVGAHSPRVSGAITTVRTRGTSKPPAPLGWMWGW
jgi:filamentous hemagglutinin family protein